ncbi:hypothetical protein [Streptomyces canus]|uniref:hypothetical protein n=1 Tax=Streptomyces canus TaxID=58343 RepID=UPI0003681F6F|nr:hypothetical protein [Streptomyces canus]
MTTVPQPGQTYTITEPPHDPACTDQGCPLDRPDMLFPYMDLLGKRVTVTETGHTLNGHPAAKITCGPVDWHPSVMVTLTTEQAASLGIIPTPAAGYFIVGKIWAADSADMPILPAADIDDFPIEIANPVEMPKQRTEIIPVSCLHDPTVSRDEKRRADRLRKIAKTRGLKLKRMRGQVSPRSTGPYLLVDATFEMRAVAGSWFGRAGLNLDEIETVLNKQQERQP